jgi:hypothetical protein
VRRCGRAEFNKAVVALAASLFFDPERLTESQKVDAALLRDHESLTRDFVRRQHHARPQTILGPTPAATGLLEQALAVTSAPHPRLGLLVDLAMARMNEGDADHAITLLVKGTQLAIERGIEGFALAAPGGARPTLAGPAARLDSRLHAVAQDNL